MNFDNYFELLQQIEKPTFVFDRFDNQDIKKIYLQEVENYIFKKEEYDWIRKRIRNLFSAAFSLIEIDKYQNKNILVKFYAFHNLYLITIIDTINKKYYEEIAEAITKIENCQNNINELKNVYRYLLHQINGLDGDGMPTLFNVFLADVARYSNNDFYFNITTTEKDYFTLEIIIVIHKVIA